MGGGRPGSGGYPPPHTWLEEFPKPGGFRALKEAWKGHGPRHVGQDHLAGGDGAQRWGRNGGGWVRVRGGAHPRPHGRGWGGTWRRWPGSRWWAGPGGPLDNNGRQRWPNGCSRLLVGIFLGGWLWVVRLWTSPWAGPLGGTDPLPGHPPFP